VFNRVLSLAAVAMLGLVVAGCNSSVLDIDTRGSEPIPAKLVGEMSKKSMTPSSPVLVRIFKKESELELWKRDKSGRFALLKTYPICRWSGQLGPKRKIGDRHTPEGFYHVNAGMLNPKSQYYLSFNLGFPNRLESAHGYTGEALMVHGACSSSGCYAMTDEGIAEIYAVVRDALRGGQQSFQVQAYPFRMTSQNMAAYKGDANYAFWSDLKRGYDIFETTRTEPKVSYCEGRYKFNQPAIEGAAPADPLADCAPADSPAVAMSLPGAKAASDDTTASIPQVRAHAYVDGGMHPSFRSMLKRGGEKALAKRTSLKSVPISRPEAALADPYQE
jgi:murein L,D-transpeptidase YafK